MSAATNGKTRPMVTIEPGRPEEERLPVEVAAYRQVKKYGEGALSREVIACRSAWRRYWFEVDGHLEEQADYETVRDQVIAIVGEDRLPLSELWSLAREYRPVEDEEGGVARGDVAPATDALAPRPQGKEG